jgi:hypothetical protein
MKPNRESSRIVKDSARRMIAKSKAFVLVTINVDNQLETTREIRALQYFDDLDPLRQQFLKMCDNLQGGSIIVNGLHKKYMDVKEQAKKVEEAKVKRSEELSNVPSKE